MLPFDIPSEDDLFDIVWRLPLHHPIPKIFLYMPRHHRGRR